MTAPVTTDRRIGGAAVAGGLLMAASVAAELAHPVQRSDGSLADAVLFTVYLAVWTVGAAALLVAVLRLRFASSTRIGPWTAASGTGLLLAFGLVVVVSALVIGAPLEASFLVFAVGLLLSAVGAVLLGIGLRRSGAVGAWWTTLPVAAAGALVALASEAWHDPGLFVFLGAWTLLGIGILARSSRTATRSDDRVRVP
jgi:hypothetical protein